MSLSSCTGLVNFINKSEPQTISSQWLAFIIGDVWISQPLFCVIRLVGRARLQTELMFAAFPDSVVEPCRHKAAGNAYDK